MGFPEGHTRRQPESQPARMFAILARGAAGGGALCGGWLHVSAGAPVGLKGAVGHRALLHARPAALRIGPCAAWDDSEDAPWGRMVGGVRRTRGTTRRRVAPVQEAEYQDVHPGQQYQQQQQFQQQQQQQMGMQQQHQQVYEHVYNERQIDAMSDGTVQHMRNVYGTVGSSIAIAGIGATFSIMTPLAATVPVFVPFLGSLGALVYLMRTSPYTHSESTRTGTLALFSGLSGMTMAPLLKATMYINPWNIPLALGATTVIFGGSTVASLFAKRGSTLSWGGPLFGGALALAGCSIASFFVSPTSAFYPLLHNAWLYGGLTLFSVYVAYDTQNIIRQYEEGDRDHIRHSVDLFINLKGIFVRVLHLLNRRD